MQLSLPLAGRFVFILHRAAGFDKETISEMTGLKYSVIEASTAAEEQNIIRIYDIMEREMIEDARVCLVRHWQAVISGRYFL